MDVSPVIVITVGSLAGEIAERAQELIRESTCQQSVPAIFRFVALNEDGEDAEGAISEAYRAAADKNAVLSAEEPGLLGVTPMRVESFVIAPLDAAHYKVAASAAGVLKRCSRTTISGGRNAILLLPDRTKRDAYDGLQTIAGTLDSDVRSELLFNRCFFIGDTDEAGQSVSESDVVELVARFICLAVASDLSREIRSVPAPYVGDGPTHRAYASFSCSTIGFDPRRLIGTLSDYLASDICRGLFLTNGLNVDANGWPGRGADWWRESLEVKLAHPLNTELKELDQDDDFRIAKERLREFTLDACRALKGNMRALQRVLDHCLIGGVVPLEALSKEMKDIKKKINEIEIKILLNVPEKLEQEPLVVTRRFWKWAIGLGAAGLLSIAAALFLGGFRRETGYLAVEVTGAMLVLAGIVLAFLKRVDIVPPPHAASLTLEEQLRRLKAEYAEKNKRQNIHVALFTHLDLGWANIDSLRSSVAAPVLRRERTVFDIDIIDDGLARKFYDEEYKTRDADITAFTDEGHLTEIHQSVFSMFSFKLTHFVRKYCYGCFERLGNYDLEQLLQLRESLGGYRELQTVSSPFWYPKNPSESEKIVLAAIPARSMDGIRAVLNNSFRAQNVRYVHGRDRFKATLVHIAHGQRLNNILGSVPITKQRAE